jgi:hypothetical protein
MAKYFRVTIESNLQSTFSVVYSTNSNPTSFNHTADIWSETTPYVAATNLTYLQLTDNGGLVVVTDDDVYQIKIEDENGYCNDCTSTAFGEAQLVYSLTGIRLDYSVDYATVIESINPQTLQTEYEDHSAYGDSVTGIGRYYYQDDNPYDGVSPHYYYSNLSPVHSGLSQGSGNIAYLHNDSNSYMEFEEYDQNSGNFIGKYRYYALSGSGGVSGNSDISISSNLNLALGIDNRDTDFPGNAGNTSFTSSDLVYVSGILSYTASFPTGTNVTMSMAIWQVDGTNFSPPNGLNENDGWYVIDSTQEAVEDGTTGQWKFYGEGEGGFYDNFNGFYVKPVIKVPSPN